MTDSKKLNLVGYKIITKSELPILLDEIETYNENPRHNRLQFEKYLTSEKNIDKNAIYYGMFRNGKCEALSYLNKTLSEFVLIAQITSFKKGSGAKLLRNIMSRTANIWLLSDPDSGENLVNYYRQFGMSEYIIKHSKWHDGAPAHIFYKAANAELENILFDEFKTFEK